MDLREEKIAKVKRLEKIQKIKALESSAAAPQEELDSAPAALIDSIGDTLTLGYGPNIKAGMAKVGSLIPGVSGAEALRAVDPNLFREGEDLPKADNYDEILRLAESRGQELADTSPIASGAGVLAGSLVPGLGLAKGIGAGVKAGKALPAIAKAAGISGATSAAFDPGYNPDDSLQLAERAEAGALGAGLGALTGGLSRSGGALKDSAQRMAFRAIGKAPKRVTKGLSPEKIQSAGQEILESDLLKGVPKTAAGMSKKLNTIRTDYGKQIGSVIEEVDDLERSLTNQNIQFTGVQKDGIKEKVRAAIMRGDEFDDPKQLENMEKALAKLSIRGGDSPSFPTKVAQDLKKEVGDRLRKNNVWTKPSFVDLKPADQYDLALYRALDDGIIESVEQLSKVASPSTSAKFANAKKKYGMYKMLESISDDTAAGRQANNMFGLGSMMGGAGTLASGANPAAAGAAALAIKGAKEFGPQVAARGMDIASRAIPQTSPVTSGLLGGAISAEAPSEGAKLLKMSTYDESPMVPVPPDVDVSAVVMDSDLTNVEKAKILRRYKKDGMVSEQVMQYFEGAQQ